MQTQIPPPQPPLQIPRMIVNPLPPAVVHSAFWEQASRASWIAPIIAIVLGMVTLSSRQSDRGSFPIIGLFNGGLILVGLVLSIAAMYGAIVKGVKGVLGGAIVGLIINGGFIFVA